MDRIVLQLRMPRDFFLKPIVQFDGDRIYYRSMSAATKTARLRAEARYGWLREIVAYLRKYLDFLPVNIPAFSVPEDPRDLTSAMVEDIAGKCREFYRLGNGPVPDLVALLESNGLIVTRGDLGAETLDAFSQVPPDDDRPYLFAGADKGSAVRSRFDCAHEMGHVLLHRRADPSLVRNAHVHSLMERQGHLFASCFLLPEAGFVGELWAPTLDGFAALKPRWRVSIAMMLKRTEDLGIVNETQAKRLWINLSRRGWRKEEPLDSKLVPEQPRLLRRSFEILVDSGVKSKSQIVQDLCFPAFEIEALACLPVGFLSEDKPVEPKLKSVDAPGVIPFRPKHG
jgi:Zn-dependent peptidase ImmA (M78 family)